MAHHGARRGLLRLLLLAPLLVAACGTPPRASETVWATVSEIYSPESLEKPWNSKLAERLRSEGVGETELRAGRVIAADCGIGSDYSWRTYALAPAGMTLRKEQVVRLAVKDQGNDDRFGWNAVTGIVEPFPYPGSLRAYNFIPDWREKGLSHNIERIALQPAQRGRYVIVHSSYLIKCRQGLAVPP
jgi:hypothetical protein